MYSSMNFDVVVTCAVTGGSDTAGRHPEIPVTPEQIANASIDAAKAGAAMVHVHVRDPETGKGARDPELFKETIDRIRDSDTDVILNLTCGMGGDFIVNDADLHTAGAGSDLVSPEERTLHLDLMPEICSLDCGTMNFGNDDGLAVNTPNHLRRMAQIMKDKGVKPELEVFDVGQMHFANKLIQEGYIEGVPLYQVCLGIPGGAPADTHTMKAMVDMIPDNGQWHAFGISRWQMPMVAQAILLGGNVRVGLEDNLFLSRGVLASNAQLVEKAIGIVEQMGARILSPEEARKKLDVKKRV